MLNTTNLWQVSNNIPTDKQPFWTKTLFSEVLIQQNAKMTQAGYCLHVSYPTQGGKNPFNLAEMTLEDGTQLAVAIVNDYNARYNISFKERNSNFALLAHAFLDNTICYLEADSYNGQYKEKVIATRNLRLVNNNLEHPINNFDLLLAVLSCNINILEQLKALNPSLAEVIQGFINISQEFATTKKLSKANATTLADSFNTDTNTITYFYNAVRYLSNSFYSCIEKKVAYIKLKPAKTPGKFELMKRLTGTAYSFPTQTILVPLTFIRDQADVITNKLKTDIMHVRFKRANGYERVMLATNNPQVLDAIYKDKELTKKHANPEYIEKHGCIRTVDICTSKVSSDITRQVTLCRINAIGFLSPNLNDIVNQLKPYGFDPSIAEADLSSVVETFKTYIDKYQTNLAFLTMIYSQLTKAATPPVFANAGSAIIALNQFVDTQASLSNDFKRLLHLFMLNNPVLFAGYTGKLPEIQTAGIVVQPRFQNLGLV